MATNLVAGLSFSADWYHFTGSVTTGRTDPIGGTGASKFIPDISTANHNLGYDKSGLAGAARKATLYLSAHPAGYNCLWAYLSDGSVNYRGVGYDVSTGSVGGNGGNGTATIINSVLTQIAGGYYRLRLVVSLPSSSVISTVIRSADNSNVDYMTGDGTSGIDLFDAALYDGYVMEGFSGAYALAGTAATLKKGSVAGAASGSYSLSGTAAILTYTPVAGYTLAAASGAFTETGTVAGLYYGRVVAAASGSFAFTGAAATLTYTPNPGSYTLTADPGSITYTPTAAGLLYGRLISSASASFALTGQAATLTKAGLNAYTLTALGGAYALTGSSVTFLGRTWTPIPVTAETWTPVPPAPTPDDMLFADAIWDDAVIWDDDLIISDEILGGWDEIAPNPVTWVRAA